MVDDARTQLLPRFPYILTKDDEFYANLQKIYDTVNILAQELNGLVGGENYSQDERAEIWAQGNSAGNKLAVVSRKLVRYSTACSPGDILKRADGGAAVVVQTGTAINGNVVGICVDPVEAGAVGYMYIKGVVPFTKFALTPGTLYGTFRDAADGNTNSMFPIRPVDFTGTLQVVHSLVGMAVSPNSILLQSQQWG